MSRRRRKRKHRDRQTARVPVPPGGLAGWCDGACAGNPGPMGIGGLLRDGTETVCQYSESAGMGSNNEAEYLAMIRLLECGLSHGVQSLVCHSDSELVVRQLLGEYSVRKPHLYRLYRKALNLASEFSGSVRFVWVPRERNADADALASQAVGMPQAPVTDGQAEPWIMDETYVPDREALDALPVSGANIDAFLAKSDHRFRDFISLRTGGIDGYSRLSLDRLQEIITVRHGPTANEWLGRALDGAEESTYGKDALRCCARGLPPDLALKKASVNLEMAERALRSKHRRRH